MVNTRANFFDGFCMFSGCHSLHALCGTNGCDDLPPRSIPHLLRVPSRCCCFRCMGLLFSIGRKYDLLLPEERDRLEVLRLEGGSGGRTYREFAVWALKHNYACFLRGEIDAVNCSYIQDMACAAGSNWHTKGSAAVQHIELARRSCACIDRPVFCILH